MSAFEANEAWPQAASSATKPQARTRGSLIDRAKREAMILWLRFLVLLNVRGNSRRRLAAYTRKRAVGSAPSLSAGAVQPNPPALPDGGGAPGAGR